MIQGYDVKFVAICELWVWLCDELSLGNVHTEYWGGCSSGVCK